MPNDSRTSTEPGVSHSVQNVWWPTLWPLNTTFTLKMVSNSYSTRSCNLLESNSLLIEDWSSAMALFSSYRAVLPLSSPSRNSWGKDHIWKRLKRIRQSHCIYNSDRLVFLSLDHSEEACVSSRGFSHLLSVTPLCKLMHPYLLSLLHT